MTPTSSDREGTRREQFEREMRKHHQVVISKPVTFLAGNGPIIVRTEGMSDEDWQEIVERETKRRCP